MVNALREDNDDNDPHTYTHMFRSIQNVLIQVTVLKYDHGDN